VDSPAKEVNMALTKETKNDKIEVISEFPGNPATPKDSPFDFLHSVYILLTA
jgi:hypothetical protein